MNHVLGGGPVPRWLFTEMEMDHVLGIVPGPSWLLWGRFPGQIQFDFIAVRTAPKNNKDLVSCAS
jgi:hypothetical protein